MKACIKEINVAYITANKLFDRLMYAKLDGSYLKLTENLFKYKLLIIDNKQCTMMLDIIDYRRGKCSTVITSQLSIKNWYDCFTEPTMADAILDRVNNGSYRIDL